MICRGKISCRRLCHWPVGSRGFIRLLPEYGSIALPTYGVSGMIDPRGHDKVLFRNGDREIAGKMLN